ncbi:MAG: flagellar biosynthetic protein FliR [Defluviitaleaceae bacterium]|nr:flagellar biosynthetic protein FliR [Defluviitaleaceae bacterium]
MELLPLLINFFNNIDVLMLILVRVSAFLIFMPVLSGMAIPMQFRLFFAFVISVAIFTSGNVTAAVFNDTVSGFVMLIVMEFITGAVMGYILFFVFNLIIFAGHYMDFATGFAMVNVMDPLQQIQVPLFGNLLFMTISALLVVMGGLHILMSVFFDSFRLIPMGAAFIIGNAPLVEFMVWTFVGFVILALQIALPLMGTVLLIDVCLGIMVKSVPQMNVFVIGMPIKVMIGLFLVYSVIIPNTGTIYDTVFNVALEGMASVIEGIAPYEDIVAP